MHIMKIETQIKLHSEDAMQKTGIVASGWVEIGDCIKFPVRVMKYTDKTSGEEKSFVSYPQRKTKDGYEVIVFPHDKEARKEIGGDKGHTNKRPKSRKSRGKAERSSNGQDF